MKKFYSLVLMAAALLIGTNVWANAGWDALSQTQGANKISVTIGGVTKYAANLQAAVDAVDENQTATIKLLADQELTATVLIPNYLAGNDTIKAGTTNTRKPIRTRLLQDITLDMNGFKITEKAGSSIGLIQLMKGKLHITGEGELKQTHAKGGNNIARSVIFVSGAPYANKNEEWSTLIIDENVFLNATGKAEGSSASTTGEVAKNYGITIDQLVKLDGNNCIGYGTSASLTASSYFEADDNEGASLVFSDANIKCWAKGDWEKADLNNDGKKDDFERTGRWKTKSAGCAYGVKVIVKGKIYGNMRAINFAGNINATPKCDEDWTTKGRRYTNPAQEGRYYDVFYPYVRIEKTATLWCLDQGLTDGNGAVYAGGYGVWDISGNLYGQTGIFVKSGDVMLIDATVKSTSTESYNNPNYNETVSGSGIFISSDAGYGGNIDVQITGDTKVTGGGSAAIYDAIATNATNTQVSDLSITGGTIEPGKEGGITLTQNTANETKVTGGNIQGNVTIEGTTTTVEAIVPTTGYHTTEVVDPVTNQVTIVVSQGTAPTGQETVMGHAGTSVNWKHNDASTTAMEEDIDDDYTIAELEINQAYAQKLTVKTGKTLTVGRVVLGANAQIIVEAGAKFIVTGAQGVVAPVVDNIVLQSAGNKHATFLFNPAVTSNRHPNATVQFVSKSWYTDASHYQWERFGIPTWKALTSIESDIAGLYTNIQVFENNGWTDLGYLVTGTPFANIAQMNKPFATYNLLAYKGTAGATYTMKGELVGNENAELNTDREWNSFANSYAADVDMVTLLAGLAGGVNIDKTVYFAQPAGLGHYVWEAVNKDWVAGEKIAPMQVFLLHNSTATPEASVLNYSNMVWTPATTPASAPRRRVASDDNIARLRVVVANEEGIWDNVKLSENSDANNAVKYMNEDVNIYAMNDEKDAIVAAENLENMYLGFSTVKGGNFTISFDNVAGREFDLIDMETGAKVAVMEGATYEFTAAANTVADYRFKLVERNNAPTAIDNTEAIKSATGIYTITGQYMGEMNVWNTLPAGVYVVNGEKRVK